MSALQDESRKSSSIWIHCHRCFENYIHKQSKIFLLSCYDVACEKCVCQVNHLEVKCPICSKIGEGYLIGNNLPPNLKELFHPRPWTLNFQKTWKIVQFQNKQRDHFKWGCRKMNEYNNLLEKERDRVKMECREVYMLQKKTQDKRKQLESGLKRFMKEKSACQSLNIPSSTEKVLERSRTSRQGEFFIHSTYNAPRNVDTFVFPSDDHFSKSFIL